MPTKVTGFRLKEETINQLEEVTKAINHFRRNIAIENGIYHQELSKTQILEKIIKERYEDMGLHEPAN